MFSFKPFRSNSIDNSHNVNTIVSNIIKKASTLEIESNTTEKKRTEWIKKLQPNTDIILNKKNKYTLCSIIGEGGYGTVWKVKDMNDSYFALKILKVGDTKGEQIHIELSNCSDIIKGYNIYSVNCPSDIPDTSAFIMELGYSFKVVSYMECFFIIKNICSNLIDLNKHDLVHNDIKPYNIVRKSNGTYSLIDFSLCSDVLNITDNYLIHTLWYRPLEVLTNHHDIDYHKADIWALGCTIFELFTKKPLFPNNNTVLQIQQIKEYYDLLPEQQYTFLYNKLFDETQNDSFKNKKIFTDLLLFILSEQSNRPNATILYTLVDECMSKIE